MPAAIARTAEVPQIGERARDGDISKRDAVADEKAAGVGHDAFEIIEQRRKLLAFGCARRLLVAVTVLTSLDAADLAQTGVNGSPAEQVERLAHLARNAGIDGIVCSGAEVAAARSAWPEGFFVVPGVRPAGADTGDQKRVVTPRQALDDGASVLVIGRPITAADDPARAIREISATL